VSTLVYNPGEPDEKSFAIGDVPVTIGRGDDQAICIRHRSLSRSQARIEPSEGRFFIVDLGSKNGTLVNGVRVQRKEVRHGDTITFGDLDLVFRSEPDAASHRGTTLQPHATRALLRSPITRLAGERGSEGSGAAGARAESRLRTLIEVTKLLPVSDDIDALLRKILDLVFQILDVDRGVILLLDEQTGKLEPRVVKTTHPVPDGRPIYSQKIVQYVLEKSVAALFSDAAHDPRLDTARSVVMQSICASMCVPLKPKDDVIGVLYVDNQSAARLFAEDDLEFLLAFASQAAVALENATLYRRLEQETVVRMQLIMEAKLASLSAVVAGIAHEIRNPLNFMINFAELSTGLSFELEEGLRPHQGRIPPAALAEINETLACLRDNTDRIGKHGRRASDVIQSMLQHTRRPAGAREEADLNAVVAESVSLACGGPQGRGLEVRIVAEYDPSLAPLEMASLDLVRVFLNVVENALYAMRQKASEQGAGYTPELRVRTAPRRKAVEVRIRDNGTGIPEAVAGRVFEPFFTTKPPGQGTGLGLSLSHEIVVQGHQGTMRVESEPGAWTEIVVTLPAAP
jgi:signal transduction histidine kinase